MPAAVTALRKRTLPPGKAPVVWSVTAASIDVKPIEATFWPVNSAPSAFVQSMYTSALVSSDRSISAIGSPHDV